MRRGARRSLRHTPVGGRRGAGRDYLYKRGLFDEVLRAFAVGYNPQDVWEDRAQWGLPDAGRPAAWPRHRIWIPRGITFPWYVDGGVWRLNVRRPLTPAQIAAGQAKYIGPAGFANALYNAAALDPKGGPRKPVVLVEGEIDALTIAQAWGTGQHAEVVAVATGSTPADAARRGWRGSRSAPVVLVAFDWDETPDGANAGECAAAWWLHALPNARRLRPLLHDVNSLPDPEDVRAGSRCAAPLTERINLMVTSHTTNDITENITRVTTAAAAPAAGRDDPAADSDRQTCTYAALLDDPLHSRPKARRPRYPLMNQLSPEQVGYFRTLVNTYIPDMYDGAAVEVLLVLVEVCHILDLLPTVMEEIFGPRCPPGPRHLGRPHPPTPPPRPRPPRWVWLPNQSRPQLYPIASDGTIQLYNRRGTRSSGNTPAVAALLSTLDLVPVLATGKKGTHQCPSPPSSTNPSNPKPAAWPKTSPRAQFLASLIATYEAGRLLHMTKSALVGLLGSVVIRCIDSQIDGAAPPAPPAAGTVAARHRRRQLR